MFALLGPGPGAAEPSSPPPRLGFTDDQVLLVDGKPFLPIGLYHPWHTQLEPDALAEIAGQGFNLLEFWGGNGDQMQRFFDAAAAHGLKVFSSGATVIEDKKFVSLRPDVIERFKTHPALLCWVFWDEPIAQSLPAEELRKAYQALKQVDPHHPVYLCDYSTGFYRGYADVTDLFAADIYPIGHRPISLIQEQLTEAYAVTGGKKPVWMVVQGHSWRTVLRQPTPEELECMVFLALASGAKGILYYDFASLRSTQALWDKVGVLNRCLARLAPIILAPTSPAKVPLDPPDAPVVTLVKAHAGDTFVFAVNTSGETLHLRMALPGLSKEAQVTELLSDKPPQVSDNGLEDTFAPLAARVYRIAAPSKGR
jgi:hypothetical protein